MRRKSDTSSSCFTTRQAGVQPRRIATIQKAAFMHTTHEISAGPTTYSGMHRKTVRLSKTGWAGTTARVASNATSATRQSSVFTIQKSTRELSVTAQDATKWIFVPSSITLVKRIWPTSCASNT